MSKHELFEQTLRKMIAGELSVKWDFNEFVGHADVVRQLLEVAPDEIRDDLDFLHTLMADARDTTGSAVLGIFPRLTDPELAGVEGRITAYIAEHCGISLGNPEYVVGRTIGESRCPGWPGVGTPMTNNQKTRVRVILEAAVRRLPHETLTQEHTAALVANRTLSRYCQQQQLEAQQNARRAQLALQQAQNEQRMLDEDQQS